MRIANISISKKIVGAFAIVVIGAGCMGALVYNEMAYIERVRIENQVVDLGLQEAISARGALTRQENSLRGFIVFQDEYYAERVKSHYETYLNNLDRLRQIEAGKPAMLASIEASASSAAAWQTQIADVVLRLSRAAETMPQAIGLLRSDLSASFMDPSEEALDAIIADGQAASRANADYQEVAFARAWQTLAIGIALLVVAASLIGWMLSRGIATPIARLRDVTLKLAKGDKTVVVPAADRKDEIGQMAGAIEIFKQAAIEQDRLEAEAKALRERQEAERERVAQVEAREAEALRNFVSSIEGGFARLSQGDLTVRIDGAVAEQYEPIRAQFNGTVEKLEDTLGSVVGSIGTIRSGLGEINVASNDLAQRTEQQAASLEETVAALAEVTRAVNETAQDAGRAQASAESANRNAAKGGEIVGKAVEAMRAIEQSSDKIGKIIGVIDEIAFQTNLLALNAGVEAARAGDAGRGFAVVAQEVRGLAQRSAEAAKEIKELISASSVQVGAGVELVSASGRSLDEIIAEVGDMSRNVAEIARRAREQAVSLKEVQTAADQMDKVTQQNAAMVEQATAAAQSLVAETDELGRLIAEFKLANMRSAHAAASRTATRPTARSTGRPVVQMRTSGQGNAALKTLQDNWEEF